MRKTRMKVATILLGGLLGGLGLSACQTGDTRTYEVHVWTADWETVVEPTCTEAGEARRYCSHCNDYKTKTLAPLGHNLEEYEAREATCTRNGWEAYEACMREGLKTLGKNAFQNCSELTFNEYEGGRYLGTAENAYFALVEWRGAAPEEVTLHADVKVLFNGAVAEQEN